MKYVQVPTQHPFTDYREEEFGSRKTIIWTDFKVYELPTSRSSFKVGYLCVHVCLKRFGSRSYLCYSVLFKLCVYAIFGAFKNYDANINLIIQGELTACQCLLLFITLDETGNWRGCIAWVRISSSSSAAAYICMISLFSVYFPSYVQIYVFSLLYLNFPVHFLCI